MFECKRKSKKTSPHYWVVYESDRGSGEGVVDNDQLANLLRRGVIIRSLSSAIPASAPLTQDASAT